MLETVLIVDDESSHLRMAEYTLSQKLGYRVATVDKGEEAIHWVLFSNEPQPDIVLLDLTMTRVNALQVMRQIKSQRPQLPIIALAPYGDEDTTSQAIAAGANDVLSKPVAVDRLKLSLRNVLALARLQYAITRLERQMAGHICLSDIIGQSAKMKDMLSQSEKAAASALPVWIEGERGAGKEMLARAIHGSSDRAGRPFVVVDCSDLPGNTAEGMLFGQEKMPGSHADFVLGKIREADHGTLFFKNIAGLTPQLQHRLLETMDKKTVLPLGSQTPIPINVRMMAATIQPLKPLLDSGSFSHLLFRRFNEISIAVPPLRERKEDIALLARHFITTYGASENKEMIGLSEDALKHLSTASWPGNISQLSRLMWRAMMICNQEILDVGNLRLIEQWQPAYYKNYSETAAITASPVLFDGNGRMKKLKSIEEEVIRLALQHNGGCMTRAAHSLGIGRSTLYRRVGGLEPHHHISRENQATRPMITASSTDRS